MSLIRRLAPLLLLGLISVQADEEDQLIPGDEGTLMDENTLGPAPESAVFVGPRPWINEFHYDNKGTDVNEFIEVAAPADLDINSYQLILYDGFYGYMYEEDALHPLVSFDKGDTVNGVTFYRLDLRPQNCSTATTWCGLENGKEGFALAKYFTETSGQVVEFISYEGTFVAKNGPASNMTSNDIGVKQLTTTPQGWSISKQGTGCGPNDFYWAETNVSTAGTVNTDQTTTCAVAFVNEFHYTNENGGEGQFVEVASNVDDVSTYSVVLYNGEDGLPYDAVLLSSFEEGDKTDDGLAFYFYDFPLIGGNVGMEVGEIMEVNGTDTTMPAGMALVNNDEDVLEFISYGGSFTAAGGVAEGMTSMDVGVTETSETPIGSSIQLTGEGCSSEDFEWKAVEANSVDINPMGETKGEVNLGQTIACQKTEIVTEAPEPTEDNDPFQEGLELEQVGDDYITEDDDFLDDNVVVFTAEERTVTYVQGKRDSRSINNDA